MQRVQNPSRSTRSACLILALFATILLVGCTNGKSLTGSERDAVLSYTGPIADNLFLGMNSGDYAAFSQDFNEPMLQGITEKDFTDSFLPTIIGKLGKYVSSQVDSVTEIGNNVLIIYNAKFEKVDDVKIRLSLEKAAPHQVSGLYFNSPALTQK
jgi:hypothetical protein